MRFNFWLFFFLLILAFSSSARDLSSYEKPIALQLYSETLGDSVSVEITVPSELKSQSNREYPVVYLLDQQLRSNYTYNLSTIDYLSSLQWMPKSIIVGIAFSRRSRISWTVPNASGGRADDLIAFMETELLQVLKKDYPIADFHLLVGHSRTAIFSSYALSKDPDFFNGAIASSVSNFDFGSALQQEQFDQFLKEMGSSTHKYFYYFSTGEEQYGDLHEAAVDTLHAYFMSRELPHNLEWKFYKHHVAHELTPGLTVANALSEIFKEYGRRIDVCFSLAKESPQKVPWDDYLGVYASISEDLGFEILPAELFFNSIASMYYNDYDGIYRDNSLHFTLDILLKAIETYPGEFSYYSWIGEIYISLNEVEKGNQFLNSAIDILNNDDSISETDRAAFVLEIQELKGGE
ncbi:MAG: hypothetical protein KDC12_06145 [Flavobacteriales bacterium]|nr:hypothetical protein [Flavobacteriales bacterium]